MNAAIELLNHWAEHFPAFARAMLWQSSLLIAIVFIVDTTWRRKLRASIRYTLWMVVLVKLILPPGLASPTNPRWWIHEPGTPRPKIAVTAYTVTYSDALPSVVPAAVPTTPPPSRKPALSPAAWWMSASLAISIALFAWLILRWISVIQKVRTAKAPSELETASSHAAVLSTLPQGVRLKLTADAMSPAVCGLFRPVILLPRSLADRLSPEQLRAVLLHETIHIRRGDIWINCAQALLQIIYWWHPLLWLANARIRRVREEAVDDAVMLALRDEAEVYAPTLLEVARFAFRRPLASLGLVGILESRSALRQRIERLMEFRAPRTAGLTIASALGILAFTAIAVPMGEGPAPTASVSFPASDAPAPRQKLTVKVDLDVFSRNLKAQVANFGGTDTNPYPGLLETLDSEGVTGAVAINDVTGEITKEGTPEELEVFRKVLEQLNRADGKPELPLRDTPIHRKSVYIAAQFYKMRNEDFEGLVSGLPAYDRGDMSWWSIAPDKFPEFIGRVKSLGLKPFQRPGIETGHGMAAIIYVGEPTNNVEMSCQPFVRQVDGVDGAIDLNVWTKTVGQFTADPEGDWPIMEGTNRYAIKNQVSALDHGGVVLRAINPLASPSNDLVVVLNLQIVTNDVIKDNQQGAATIEVPTQGTVTGVLADPNFRTTLHALEQRNGVETLAEPEVVTTSGRQVNRMDPNIVDKATTQMNSAKAAGALPPADVSEHPRIVNALHGIHVGRIEYDRTPLSQVLHDLAFAARTNRINFLFNSTSDGPDPDRITVTFKSETGMPMDDLLNAIVAGADQPIQYSIQDPGIFFSWKDPNAPASMETLVFSMSKSTFTDVLPSGGGVQPDDILVAARDVFSKKGVDLTAPGRRIGFNRLGLLYVTATRTELNIIEQTIQALEAAIPQIHMKARFIAVPKKRFTLPATFTNIISTEPLTGILDDADFRTILRNLYQLKDVETIAEPEVVTLTGRQTQMRVTDVQYILTNFTLVETVTNSMVAPQIAQFEIGPTIDLLPHVRADGYTINLTAIPEILEFLGYEPPKDGTTVVNKSGQKLVLPKALPGFRVTEAKTTVNLRDNQTLLLGNLASTFVNGNGNDATESKYFADKEKKSGRTDKELLVFVTVTLVDAAGNRVHSDDDPPSPRK